MLDIGLLRANRSHRQIWIFLSAMSLQTFLLFVISTFLVSATPGSNMLFAFQCGLNHGVKKTMWAMAGLMLGLFVLLFGSLLGLSA
ncbi:MAG: hypothetical protein Q4G13_00695 [Moraxella sp.]|nr:hypothetical protein [Moraxella sp.]